MSNGLRKDLKAQGTQVLAVHVAYMDTDMTAGIQGEKSPPRDVAAQIVQALGQGRSELLADPLTQSVKAGLGLEAAPYLA